ncbi:MAG: recombination regulator RecX [Comamonadaceae bacterium]|nr:recombination regulator RecX [Comamonadaceae bacterium]
MRPALSLKGRALRCLARREHSRVELERKLERPREPSPASWQRALDELQAKGFINEQRVVESVLHRARRPPRRRARPKQELQAKGIGRRGRGRRRWRSCSGTELERAREVWRKKFGEPARRRRRAGRNRCSFLASRGFGAEAIRRVVQGGRRRRLNAPA